MRRLLAGALGEHNAQKSACKEKQNYKEERSARTTSHLEISFVEGVLPPQLRR